MAALGPRVQLARQRSRRTSTSVPAAARSVADARIAPGRGSLSTAPVYPHVVQTYTTGAALEAARFVCVGSVEADMALPSWLLDERSVENVFNRMFQESWHKRSSRSLPNAAGASEDQGLSPFGSSTGTPRPMFVASTPDRRQVSWLADRRLVLPSRRHIAASGVHGRDFPLTVAGAAADLADAGGVTSLHSLFALSRGTVSASVIDFAGPACQCGRQHRHASSASDVEGTKPDSDSRRRPLG